MFNEAGSNSQQQKSKQQTKTLVRIDIGALGYVDTSTKTLWSSFQSLLLVCVQYVGVDAKSFDEVLFMLRPVVKLDARAIEVLETENADATWLARYKEEQRHLIAPVVQGCKFAAAVH